MTDSALFPAVTRHLTLYQVTFDPTSPDMKRLTGHREILHAAIAAATNGARRPLWRLDGDRLYILTDMLDEDRLTVRLGGNINTRSADYEKFLSAIKQGRQLSFTLYANPTVKRAGHDIPLRLDEERSNWCRKRLESSGCSNVSVIAGNTQVLSFGKPNGDKVTLQQTRFDGTLTVDDTERFTDGLATGIGRGKAYGLGLLLAS